MAEVFKDQEKAPEQSGTSTFLTKMEAFPNRTDCLESRQMCGSNSYHLTVSFNVHIGSVLKHVPKYKG